FCGGIASVGWSSSYGDCPADPSPCGHCDAGHLSFGCCSFDIRLLRGSGPGCSTNEYSHRIVELYGTTNNAAYCGPLERKSASRHQGVSYSLTAAASKFETTKNLSLLVGDEIR